MLKAVFALTVQCAKASGLYHWRSFESQLNQEEINEFQNVALCLYVLDKEVGWVSGSFPNISISEMHLNCSSTAGSLSDLDLRAELSAIEESVYLEAYTSSLECKAQARDHQTKSSMSERLDNWLLRCNLKLKDVETKPENSPREAELAAGYFCVKMLIVWPLRDPTEGISTECVDIARRCMAHLLQMWSSASELGQNMAVPM